jgi:DNA end-binding protein Ku
MPRAIWSGTLSFGLLHVPVYLMPGERRTDLHFRMLDSRDNAPIRYERVNSETGEEVPWSNVVKAFEYDKGSYVVLEEEDLRAAAPESHESVDLETFVDADAIPPQYYDKPYVLTPGKKAQKGYVLLRETLAETGKIGIARVVVRTREYLAAVMPRDSALVLLLLRYPQELVELNEYDLPDKKASEYRVTAKELGMARQLIESMTTRWKPTDYRDEFRDRLHAVIEERMRSQGVVTPAKESVAEPKAATNVVDFMKLLQRSIQSKRRSPAKKKAAAAPKKKTKPAAKKTAPARRRRPA